MRWVMSVKLEHFAVDDTSEYKLIIFIGPLMGSF